LSVTLICVSQVTTMMVIPFVIRRHFLKWLVRLSRHHKVPTVTENSVFIISVRSGICIAMKMY